MEKKMKGKSYPYIGKDNYGKIYLMLSGRDAITMDSDNFTHTPMEEDGYKNITHEYLANTYGEVQSPEHAEFIAELAENAGFELARQSKHHGKFFSFDVKGFCFLDTEIIASQHCKKITIPLPPKQIQTATPEEEFEMTQIMKNAGDNLVLGCEDSKCEWPQVGDEVLVYPNSRRLMEIRDKVVKVIGKCFHSDGSTIITVEHSSLGVFAVAEGPWIRKPKTQEEELRDEVTEVVRKANDLWGSTTEAQQVSVQEFVATKIMDNYNITKKPQ